LTANKLIGSNDQHICTAGLIILQDALEIIFISLLTEIGVDEKKSLESKGFDELIGELRTAGITVPKSGTLKALNKQRVISKHYGQLAETVTVKGYAEAADIVVDSILLQVIHRKFHDIYLSDLLAEGESLELLKTAASLIENKRYLEALIEIRRAIFIEVESECCVDGWADYNPGVSPSGGLSFFLRGGGKAYSWTKNAEWIKQNVKTPVDYVQVDRETLKLDAIEWGVNTSELENLLRLTPNVFRSKRDAPWYTAYNMDFPPNEANESNAKYCLNLAVSIILQKQQHTQKRRYPKKEITFTPPTIYLGDPVYARASQDSEVVHVIQENHQYQINRLVSGFDPTQRYYFITCSMTDPPQAIGTWISGFLLVKDEIIPEKGV